MPDAQSSPDDRAAGQRRWAARWSPGSAPLWWALLVFPLWAALALCAHWEPVLRDGWYHRVWYHAGNTLGLRSIYAFARVCYLEENPRLGQVMTLLSYSDSPYHVIVTPLLELAVLAMLTAAALGRWPRLRRSDDALAAVVVTALLASCVPQFGPMLLYRPFTWNYVFGFALNLGWLLPYRFAVAARPARGAWRAPAICALGFAAGLCNEHTGVAFIAMGALATAVAWRRGALRVWMIAGLIGLIAGYAVLLTAPAQHLRYAGLGARTGIVDRIAERGVGGNLWLLAALAGALVPALAAIAIGWTQRPASEPSAPSDPSAATVDERMRRASHVGLALGGAVCAVTLLASPKLGPRLYFASVALISAGITGWLIDRLYGRPSDRLADRVADRLADRLPDRLPALQVRPRIAWFPAARARRIAALLAGAVVAVIVARLVFIHSVVGPLGAIRSERIEHGPQGAAVVVPRYPFPRGREFLGDDLLDPLVRDQVARQFHLGSVALEPP